MTHPLENASRNYLASQKDFAEMNQGVSELLRGDVFNGIRHTVAGAAGGLVRREMAESDSAPYGGLPAVELYDAAGEGHFKPRGYFASSHNEMDSVYAGEQDMTAYYKKEKAEALANEREHVSNKFEASQRHGGDENGRIHVVKQGESLWSIVADDYRRHHGGHSDHRMILERTNALREQYGRVLNPGDKIELPEP